MRRRIAGCAGAGVALTFVLAAPVWGSIFGEENVTLVQILGQLVAAKEDLADINRYAGQAADLSRDLLASYERVHAGIERLQSYSGDAFLYDLEEDLYRQYPGIGKLDGASRDLARWDDTHGTSPFTAYQAITAVMGDATAPLRNDIAAGRAKIDRELILSGEAAGGFALAEGAERASKDFDESAKDLYAEAKNASPGEAAQVSARAELLLVKQQSLMLSLLARTVRFDATRASLEYGARMDARNSTYARAEATGALARQAGTPPALLQFGAF
jgi:hypothetical protein